MSVKNLLDQIEVQSPCAENWDEMVGNNEVRFCSHCAKSVNNLSAMTRKQALRVVRQSNGNICVRYVKTPDGKRLTLSGKLHQLTRRAPSLAASVVSASIALSAATYAQEIQPAAPAVAQIEVIKAPKTDGAAASVSGYVTDANGAVVPFALVTLISDATNFYQTANSSAEGFYEFKDIKAGDYKLKFDAAGFDSKDALTISVAGGETLRRDAQMDVQKVQEVVQVGETISESTMGVVGLISISNVSYNPLVRAVFNEDLEEVKVRVAMNARINARDKGYAGATALHAAVEIGNVEITQFLLTHGAKINARDFQKRTPLMMLDEDATPELVNLLLRYGAKINLVDKEGGTILHHFAATGDEEITQLLIQNGANVNAVNKEGKTALMIAAENGAAAMIKILLGAGADVNLKTKKGETAMSLARENNSDEIVAALTSYGAPE